MYAGAYRVWAEGPAKPNRRRQGQEDQRAREADEPVERVAPGPSSPVTITWEDYEANQRMIAENAHMQKRAAWSRALDGTSPMRALREDDARLLTACARVTRIATSAGETTPRSVPACASASAVCVSIVPSPDQLLAAVSCTCRRGRSRSDRACGEGGRGRTAGSHTRARGGQVRSGSRRTSARGCGSCEEARRTRTGGEVGRGADPRRGSRGAHKPAWMRRAPRVPQSTERPCSRSPKICLPLGMRRARKCERSSGEDVKIFVCEGSRKGEFSWGGDHRKRR